MGWLNEVVKQTVAGYATKGLNGYSILTESPDQTYWTVISVAHVNGRQITATSLIVHLEAEKVIIDHDINNKPLLDALEQAGVPREQIICAYADERIPELA